MKKIISIFLTSILLIMATPIKADLAGAITYLRTLSPDDWITMALVAGGETNVPKIHLQSFSGIVATDYAKRILAIKAIGENPTTFAGVDLVAGLKSLANNNQIGSVDLLNDDAWGIMALIAAGVAESDPVIAGAKAYLLSHQNIDGGWGYGTTGDSDTNDTAAVLMALKDVGLSASDTVVISAITYLKNQQNIDGGLPFVAGSASDSGSTAWVVAALNKFGLSASDWIKGTNNPLLFLQSLQLSDGSYKWQVGDTAGSPSMTAFIVVALSGKYYPVTTSMGSSDGVVASYRIEGSNTNVCAGQITAVTALDVVKNAASTCGYTYEIQTTSYGPYLKKINNDVAAGTVGWMYMVNYQPVQIGAADYNLQAGDSVLWYFGEYTIQPLRLKLSKSQAQIGESITITSEKLSTSGIWASEAGVTINGLASTLITDTQGVATFIVGASNVSLWGEKLGGIRTSRVGLQVGSSGNQSVGLEVTIEPNITPPGGGTSVSFTVSNSNLSLGSLKSGQSVEKQITITNTSSSVLYFEANVSGDAVFIDNLQLNQQSWDGWQTQLGQNATTPVIIKLPVPANYTNTGVKSGALVFWAIATN